MIVKKYYCTVIEYNLLNKFLNYNFWVIPSFRILQHFNTTSNEYSVIFTSGATEALKVVAENFEFSGNASKQLSTGKSQTLILINFIHLGDYAVRLFK